MLSYNLVNGRPAHVSDLVGGELRQWRNGGDITIVTDAGAPSSLYTAEKYFDDAASAYAGCPPRRGSSFTEDSDNPEPSLRHLKDALDRGLISEVDIDRAVGRLLALRERTGEFEPDGGPYGSVGRTSWDIRTMSRWPGSSAKVCGAAAERTGVRSRESHTSAGFIDRKDRGDRCPGLHGPERLVQRHPAGRGQRFRRPV